jgi:HlyD family secretion protein
MRKIVFALSVIGVLAAAVAAHLSGMTEAALPPAFTPAINPYAKGIYANGIIESDQPSGSNINIYPEVSGTVTQVLVAEGQRVAAGTPLVVLDDSTQRATVEQLRAQAEAAFARLQALRAEPRPEVLEIAEAQVVAAEAALKTAENALAKQRAAYELDARSISKDALDGAADAAEAARAGVVVARRQRDLTKAGAWVYDIRNQERQFQALTRSHASANALLAKYTLRAPRDGQVLAIAAAVGGFASPQGTYDSYTQRLAPIVVLGTTHTQLHVRCYIDEILLPKLPPASKIKAQMSVRGSNVRVPLRYLSMQPLVSPKIQLSDQRLERVDVRVLPVIFTIAAPTSMTLYPGQLVDVYIGE